MKSPSSLAVPWAWFGPRAGLVGCLVLGVGLLVLPWLDRHTANLAYDCQYWGRAARPATEAVVIVQDDDSHAALKQKYRQPWDRGLHAQLLDRLTEAGAKVVVFDILFDEEGVSAEQDKAFARAMQRNGKTILFGYAEKVGADATLTWGPLPDFRDASRGVGLGNLRAGEGFKVRDQYRHVSRDGRREPSLAWLAAEVATAPSPPAPAGENRHRWLNYYGPPGVGLPQLSYHAALDAQAAPATKFKDKAVFIGAGKTIDYTGVSKDEWVTPYGLAPGVMVHATACANLLRGDALLRAPPWIELLLVLGAGLLAGGGLHRLRPISGSVAALAGVTGVVLVNYWLLSRHHVWFNWVIILAQFAAGWLWWMLWSMARGYFERQLLEEKLALEAAEKALVGQTLALEQAERNLLAEKLALEQQQKKCLEQSLSLQMAPARVRQMMENPDLLKPGGEKRRITILFTDIADFADIAEPMGAEPTMALLNQYFEVSLGCIQASEGTVVKLIGDAIFAIWNAPMEQPGHEGRACLAALKLRERVADFNRQQLFPLRTRVGLHTGDASVGNVGSSTRFDYTAVGVNVNLASRLEGLNKHLGTRILLSDDTKQALGELVVTRFVGRFKVKGFGRAVDVLELVGGPETAVETTAWRAAYEAAWKCLSNREFASAKTGFEGVLKLKPDDGPAKFYLDRIPGLPDDWNGTVNMDEK